MTSTADRSPRPLGTDAAAELARLLRTTLGPAWSTASVCAELQRRGAWAWGLWEAGRLLSAALGWRLFDEAEVTAVATEPSRRGEGLASLVLRTTLDELDARGVHTCFLEVEAHNEAALRLYLRHGFQESGRRPDYYGPGRDALTMSRKTGLPVAGGK